jgi:rhodanese-related sulfurtransferase
MKIIKPICMVVLFSAVSICLLISVEAQSSYSFITAANLKKMRDSGEKLIIIDTLPGSNYKQGHIPGAKHFEFPNGNMDPWDRSLTSGMGENDFTALLGGDKDTPIIFYCWDDK